MNSAFSFKDNIALANGKFLNFIDTNNIRKDVIGLTLGSNDLHIKSVGGNVVINDGSNSITYLNTNNTSPVMIKTKLSIGYTSDVTNDNLLNLNKNGYIGINSNDGYLGLIGSRNSTSGSKILLHGDDSTNLGSLQLYANSVNGHIEMYTNALKRMSIYNNGGISFTPNGSSARLNITNTDTEIDNKVTIYNTNNSINTTNGGALTIKGGAAIEKDLYVGGVLYVDDLASFNLTSEILTTANLRLSDTTDATSTTDGGPLTISGGAAIAKNLIVGGSIISSSNSFTYSGSIRSSIDETSPTIITGLNFTDILVRSFTATISISITKSDNSKLYRVFEIKGIKSFNEPNGWLLTTNGSGDTLNYIFTIQVNGGTAQLYYKSPGIANFQLLSMNYTINCITNIDAFIEIPNSINPQTFRLESGLVPNGILIGDSIGSSVITTSKLTFNGNDMTITGNIIPSADLVYNLGSPTRQWNDLFLAGNTIHLGPCKLSANINSTDSCLLNFTSKTHSKTHLYLDGYTISKMGTLSCSDERLKTNVKPLELNNTLNIIRSLEPKEYTLKNNTNKMSYGFLAQDLQKVIPSAILKTQTVIPLSSLYGSVEKNMLILNQPLQLDEIKQLQNKSIQIQVDDKKYNIEITSIHSETHIELNKSLPNNKVLVKINGYIDNNVLHVEKDSLYTMAIGAIKALDKLLQTEILEHNKTKKRLDYLETYINQNLKK